MNKWKWIFWGLVIFAGALFYFGVFNEIKIQEQDVGPFKVVYETHIGDYSEVNGIHDKIYNSLIEDGITTTRSFGIYYDNPKNVPTEQLRSEVGVIIEEKDYSEIEKFRRKYNLKSIPKIRSVVTNFPMRADTSITIGMLKVYPKLQKYQEEHEYKPVPVMEIYDNKNKLITYSFEIKN